MSITRYTRKAGETRVFYWIIFFFTVFLKRVIFKGSLFPVCVSAWIQIPTISQKGKVVESSLWYKNFFLCKTKNWLGFELSELLIQNWRKKNRTVIWGAIVLMYWNLALMSVLRKRISMPRFNFLTHTVHLQKKFQIAKIWGMRTESWKGFCFFLQLSL